MTQEELDQYVTELLSRLPLGLYVERRFAAAPTGGELQLDEYRYRGLLRDREPRLEEMLSTAKLLILAEPGAGKSVVARAAVHGVWSHQHRVPIFAELKEYRGDLAALLATSAPPEVLDPATTFNGQTLARTYVFDGLDEIPIEHIATFDSDLKQLLEHQPDAHVIATARQAFYVSNRDRLQAFPSLFHILDFADQDVREYVVRSEIDWNAFSEAVRSVDSSEDVRNPFILSSLVEQFRATGRLSDRRSDTVSFVINRLIQSRPAINEHQQRRALRMIATALETYARNELTVTECVSVIREAMGISEEQAEQLLDELYRSILKRTANGLAFQLRSHGEYLAAEELENASMDRVRELAFFDFDTPNDSWVNTISYLAELNPEVKKYFIARHPIWLTTSSPAAFSESERTLVVTKVLDGLHSEQRSVTDDPRISVRKLARFITPDVERRLVQELQNGDDVAKGNALVLLGVLRRVPDLSVALRIALDRTRSSGARYCGIVAIVNGGDPSLIPELIRHLDHADPARINIADAIGAIADESSLATVFPIVFNEDAMLSSTYYHLRELQTREALVETLRFFIANPGELAEIRVRGYVEPILKLIELYFDDDIASLCVDLFISAESSSVYIASSDPVATILTSLGKADTSGIVPKMYFERLIAAGEVEKRRFDVERFVVPLMTSSTATWLIESQQGELIERVAPFVRGEVRELLRPHSNGYIDGQDAYFAKYKKEEDERLAAHQTEIEQLQGELVDQTKIDDALLRFHRLGRDHWPELPERFRSWLQVEISSALVRLDLKNSVEWKGSTLYQPGVLPLIMQLVKRYRLRVTPDTILIYVVTGWDDGTVTQHVKQFGVSADAAAIVDALVTEPPTHQAQEHLIRFIEETQLRSAKIDTALRQLLGDGSVPQYVRVNAVNLLVAHDANDELLLNVLATANGDLRRHVHELLVQREHRPTIERGLSAIINSSDDDFKKGNADFPGDSPYSWIGLIRAEFAWKKLAHIRERSLRLELPALAGLVTDTLARIDRSRTAKLIATQARVAPLAWRHVQQSQAIEQERTARIEAAQRTPFDIVIRKLKGATSINRLKVVCEGQTDVPVFRGLLAQVAGTPDVLFDFVGGWNGLQSKDPNSFLLGAKAAIVVMDGDNGRILARPDRPYTEIAREQETRLRSAGVELRVLRRYGIENYFPGRVLTELAEADITRLLPVPEDVGVGDHLCIRRSGLRHAVRSLIAQLAHLAPPPASIPLYHKKNNERAANMISLEGDLAGSDLYEIVQEAARVAAGLQQ